MIVTYLTAGPVCTGINEEVDSVKCEHVTGQEQQASVSYYNSPTDGIIYVDIPAFNSYVHTTLNSEFNEMSKGVCLKIKVPEQSGLQFQVSIQSPDYKFVLVVT